MRLVPEAAPSRISLAGRRYKLLKACGKERLHRSMCSETMRRDANAFHLILARCQFVQTLTTSQICVLEHCLLLSAYDMAICRNTKQKQISTAELQLFDAGIILRFIRVLHRSEFLLKTIFWKQNTLSSSLLPGEFSPFAFPHSRGNSAKKKPQKLFRGGKRSTTLSDPTASRDKARTHHPGAGAVLRAGAFPIVAKASLQGGELSRERRRFGVLSLTSKHAAIISRSQVTPAKWKPNLPVDKQPLARARLLRGSSACPASGCNLIT